MHKFYSSGKFLINGKRVFSLKSPSEAPIEEIMHKEVEIDGKNYIVIGIERFAINLGKDNILKDEPIGLMVTGV